MAAESIHPELERVLADRAFLRRLAAGLVASEHELEDVVQDAAVRALERPPREQGAARAWLARVARNLALTQRMRELARPEVERRAARPEQAPSEEDRDLELHAAVVAAVRALRQPYRLAIHMRYWRGLSPRAIAKELKLPEATVKTHLRRGLEALRSDLDHRHGGDRAQWCAALVVLALPELALQAGGLSFVSLCSALTEGILVMQKSVTLSIAAASLIAIATVAWYVSDSRPATAEARPAVALAPDRALPLAPAPPVDELPGTPGPLVEASARSVPAPEPSPAASGGSPKASGRIVGRVLDEVGRPVAAAEVVAGAFGLVMIPVRGSVDTFEAARVTTGADGRFAVPVDEDGSVALRVTASGFAPLERAATGYYDLESDAGDLVLRQGASLAGRVVDSRGNPVPGAELRATEAGSQRVFLAGAQPLSRPLARTDERGRFTIDALSVGPWSLSVRSAEHPQANARGETHRPGERVDALEIVLRDGATISGHVTGLPAGVDPTTLEVRAGAVGGGMTGDVVFGDGFTTERTAEVGADGAFTLRGLHPDFGARVALYGGSERFPAKLLSRVLEVPANASGVDLAWSAGAVILARVVDASTSAPIEDFAIDARVEAPFLMLDGPAAMRHHPGGVARVDGLRVGEKQQSARAGVTISAPGYAAWTSEVLLPRDRELDLGLVRLEPVPAVRVRVLDERGAPHAGARVRLAEENAESPFTAGGPTKRVVSRTVSSSPGGALRVLGAETIAEGVTDESGRVLLTGAPGKHARLSVDARRYALHTEELVLPHGDLEREVALMRGGIVVVHAVDASGQPLPGERVRHRAGASDVGPPLPGLFRVTDAEGRVYFRNLAPGNHGFRLDSGQSSGVMVRAAGRTGAAFALDGDDASAFTQVELLPGEERALVLAAPSASLVHGAVREAGDPLAGADVRIVDPSRPDVGFPTPSGHHATSDSQGRFSFEGVEPGEYELVLSHPSRAMPHRQGLGVRAGGERVEVELDVAIVEGRVTDGEGKPLARARVRAERASARQTRNVMITMTASSGEGSAGTIVTGSDAAPETETDEDGRFVLRGVASEASIRVRAEFPGRAPAISDTFELAPHGRRTGVLLELQEGGALAVDVSRAGAPPGMPALVQLLREGGASDRPPPMQLTNAEGRASFADISPGRWSVRTRLLGGATPEEGPAHEVVIVAGETSTLRVELP